MRHISEGQHFYPYFLMSLFDQIVMVVVRGSHRRSSSHTQDPQDLVEGVIHVASEDEVEHFSSLESAINHLEC